MLLKKVIKANTVTINEDISEDRAFYFANCFLTPEIHLSKYIKFELKKKYIELTAIDIIRIQIEFNVSYNAAVKWLSEIEFISNSHKSVLFNSVRLALT